MKNIFVILILIKIIFTNSLFFNLSDNSYNNLSDDNNLPNNKINVRCVNRLQYFLCKNILTGEERWIENPFFQYTIMYN